jgi:lia operon protein LiaG
MQLKWKIIIIMIGAAAIMGILLSMGIKSWFREIDEEKHFGLDGIDEIQVTMSSTPIHIIRTETGSAIRFHYYGKSLQEMKLASEISNKTLSVKAKRKYVFLGTLEDTCLDIFLPGEYQRNILIKTSSGAVKMDSFSLADFNLNTSSGELEAESINAAKTTLDTASGNLKIKKLGTNELEIKGTSSSINIGECTVREARIKVTSGNVILENSRGNLNIQGTSGSVSVICSEFEDRNIAVKTTSGGVTLGLPGTAQFVIEAKKTSGKFQSDFPIAVAGNADERHISGQIGTASNKVSLQTTSGEIKILKNDR